MTDKIATLNHDGRVFISIDALLAGIEIVENLPDSIHLKALRQVLTNLEKESLSVRY